ncbi:hypothetical protein [Roseateles sp.]|uniref:hypothetical protein n=1 Tax=Roseateles sp. TaxID=1971397 RepID=UPI0039EA436C
MIDALTGVLRLRPGQARPRSVENRRPDLAEALVRGKPAGDVPGMLGSLFSLCGHAHRLCARMALDAAAGKTSPGMPGAERSLQCETLCEHVRRIGLDWPAALALPASRDAIAASALKSLRACPALRGADAPLPDTRRWLERQLLAMPAQDWLERWNREPGWWAEWSAAGSGWLQRLVREARPAADWPVAAAEPLHAHAGAVSLRQLARSLSEDAGFTRRPRWQDDCAETGSWTRLNDAARALPATPWQRLGARLAELVRLTLPDAPGHGGGWLSFGAQPIAAGEGLAWVEMARGLLVHYACLDGVVAGYRVLAPTEWNFHAEGAVARALEGLAPTRDLEAQHRIAALMAAYDPCVRFEVELQALEQENVHA